MDPEQTFVRVQERFSEMLTPRIRVTLEYFFLFLATILFCILVVMHANYVQQPGCSSELSNPEMMKYQLIEIRITSASLWPHDKAVQADKTVSEARSDSEMKNPTSTNDDEPLASEKKSWLGWIVSDERRGELTVKSGRIRYEGLESQQESTTSSEQHSPASDGTLKVRIDAALNIFLISPKEYLKAAAIHVGKIWHRHLSFLLRLAKQILGGLWDIAGINLDIDIPKWLKFLHWTLSTLVQIVLDANISVQWLEKRSNAFEPVYLYTLQKGYFLLPEDARLKHDIRLMNISISARHNCFGNRWQQLLIKRLVGYDTIMINSLLSSQGQGFLYNYQTKEFYNLTYAHEQPESSSRFGDYLVIKCGVLMMSLFVFFTTTMSVSFTLRETQTRMLKFTVQLQHHARHRLPTFQLIFVHVIESLVFVPIMIGILFFLFEFYDDQLLAFMVLILVWICELFTLISVRTPISMKFFPRFFLIYFLVFHIYFFSYTHGFSYLALSTTAAFMQHLLLYFWNRFEVPALQRFLQSRRMTFQQHPDFHITSSTILASTLHITRLNTRNHVESDFPTRPVFQAGAESSTPGNVTAAPEENPNNSQPERRGNHVPGAMNSFSSLLLWILGGASSESLNSFLSIFRDLRDHGQVYQEPPPAENIPGPVNNE